MKARRVNDWNEWVIFITTMHTSKATMWSIKDKQMAQNILDFQLMCSKVSFLLLMMTGVPMLRKGCGRISERNIESMYCLNKDWVCVLFLSVTLPHFFAAAASLQAYKNISLKIESDVFVDGRHRRCIIL